MGITATEWLRRLSVQEPGARGMAANELAHSLRAATTNPDDVHMLMQHGDEGVRASVAWALQEVVENLSDFIPVVFAGLSDACADVRYWCVEALRAVPVERRREAILRLFPLLEDDVDCVRRAAADVIQVLATRRRSTTVRPDPSALRDFLAALRTNPTSFGFSGEQAAQISRVQEQLLFGYGEPSADTSPHRNAQSLARVAQAGYAIRLAQVCTELGHLIRESLHALCPDSRYVLVDRVTELLITLVDALRSLAADGDPKLRSRSWLVLDALMLEINRWRRGIAEAARDDHRRVRQACFSNLGHHLSADVVAAVVDACRDFTDESTGEDALEALKHMVWQASDVVAIGSEALGTLARALGDPKLPSGIRQRLLKVLQGYGEIFSHRPMNLDWADLLRRTVDNNPQPPTNEDRS